MPLSDTESRYWHAGDPVKILDDVTVEEQEYVKLYKRVLVLSGPKAGEVRVVSFNRLSTASPIPTDKVFRVELTYAELCSVVSALKPMSWSSMVPADAFYLRLSKRLEKIKHDNIAASVRESLRTREQTDFS